MAATATPLTVTVRCTNLGEAGVGFTSVSFQQERTEEENSLVTDRYIAPGTLTLTLASDLAQSYFPGQVYTLSLTPA